MAKRFTDTNKYKKPFIRSLPGAYKLLWDFLYHDCDHSGVWTVDFETARIYIGKDMEITHGLALKYFNMDEVRVIEIDRGKKWFLPGFIEFQYGQLSEKNRAHLSVILQLKKYGLLNPDLSIQKENKPLTSPLQGAMDMDKEKDKDMDMEQEGGVGGFEPDLILPFKSETFAEWWAKWKDYRLKVHGKTYPMPYGEETDLKRFDGFTEQEAVASIQQAIGNNWSNLYPERKNGQKTERVKSFNIDAI